MDCASSIKAAMVGGKKGNRTNRLYLTEPTEISNSCGTGFYRRHRTESANAIFSAYLTSFLFILSN